MKVGIGEELPAPRGDEAWGQEVVLRLDRVGRDCDSDGARDQSHLSTCRRGESVWEAQRSRPCRPTRRRSGSDGGDRRRSARRRRTRRRAGSGNGNVDRRRSERRRGVHCCGGSSGAGVTVGKASASQGICRVEPAREVLHVEAELLDLVKPAREEALDVPLRAQPRDHLVVGPEREVRKGPRRTEMGTSPASVVTTELRPESKVWRTGAVVRHYLSVSKLSCSAGPRCQVACGPHSRVNGAALSV